MINAKFFPSQVRAGGGPAIRAIWASDGIDVPREFYGTGAPSSSTLPTGNNKYNGISNGYVTSATVVAPGSGYAVGDVIAASGGTGTALQITVDAVNNSGAIQDWHVTTVGAYSVYPANTVATSNVSSSGSGATLNLNFPPPDHYFDTTNATSPVLYACTTKGDKSTSVWSIISGGGSSLAYFSIDTRGSGDYLTCKQVTGITIVSGVAVASTISGSTTLVAKQQHTRRSIVKENYDGTVYTYTTPGGGDLDNNRSSTDGTNSQTEYVYPRYRTLTETTADAFYTGSLPLHAQCFILAQQVTPNAGVNVSGTLLSWIEVGPSRVWVAA